MHINQNVPKGGSQQLMTTMNRHRKQLTYSKVAVFAFIFFSITWVSNAQIVDSNLNIDNESIVSSQSNLPLWLTANSWGLYAHESVQSVLGIDGQFAYSAGSLFRLSGNLSGAFIGSRTPEFLLREGLVSVEGWNLLLRGGVFRDTVGEVPNENLSSGSLAVSPNARPIPRVSFLTDDFITVPFTAGYLETNFGISHGWFTDDRYVRDVLLHEKWFYLGTKREGAFRLYAGLVHEAMWGGDQSKDGVLPVTFDNFLRVFFSRSGGEGASQSDQINKAGNALGIWDFGIRLDYAAMKLHGYYQHPFEDGSGLTEFQNGIDGLWGIAVQFEENYAPWPEWLVYEWIRTTDQSGEYHDLAAFGAPDVILGGRDNYYHHGAYRSGWTHHGRIIGTPLFLVSGEEDSTRIASNRVEGHHFGMEGSVSSTTLSYRVLMTYVGHHHAYSGNSLVDESEKAHDFHTMLEFGFDEAFGIESLSTTFGIGVDVLDSDRNTFGVHVGARYEIW